PALADLADEVLLRHPSVLEEDFTELALASDLPQRSHGHAGRVELAEDERDAAVTVLRIRAAKYEDPVGPRSEGGPHLLSVQHEVIAVDRGGSLERREVAAGPGLAEALAPDLVPGEHRRKEPAALRFAAVVDQGRPEQADAEDVQDRRGGRGGPLRPPGPSFHLGGAPAAPPPSPRP